MRVWNHPACEVMQTLKQRKLADRKIERSSRSTRNTASTALDIVTLKSSMSQTVAFFNSEKDALTKSVDKDLQILQEDFLSNSQRNASGSESSDDEDSLIVSSGSSSQRDGKRKYSSSSDSLSDNDEKGNDALSSSHKKGNDIKLLDVGLNFDVNEPEQIENSEDVNLLQADWWRCSSPSMAPMHLSSIDDSAFLQFGPKMELALQILALAYKAGEKVLLFSQSLNTLDLITIFLENDWGSLVGIGADSGLNLRGWRRGREFLRIDGSVEKRKELIDKFERDPSCCLFILSTKAGNMGINLQKASRVIIMDASWNPVHDLQAIYRAYRYGQQKTVFVYRLIAAQSMEEKVIQCFSQINE